MNHRMGLKLPALLLVPAMALSLCACAVNPADLLDKLEQSKKSSSQSEKDKQPLPQSGMDAPGGNAASSQNTAPGSAGPDEPAPVAPPPTAGTAEGQQSLQWLRDRLDVPDVVVGTAYLGYVGGLFDQGFEAGFPQWLRETNAATLEQYPFISEIDANHIAGGAGHLYCIVPIDKNATVSINRLQWDEKTGEYEITQVLYRSEEGEPVLLFANLDDIPSRPDTQVIVTDSQGNTCQWYPALDDQGHILPCIREDGVYLSTDFTEYGWKDTSAALAPWLAEGYGGMTAVGLAGWGSDAMSCWSIRAPAGESGRNADFLLVFYAGDDTGGAADLYRQYEGDLAPDKRWSGSWSLETVLDGPSNVTLTLAVARDVGSEGAFISDTYPFLISPSGLELVIGTGEKGVCLPFMSPEEEVHLLTLDER